MQPNWAMNPYLNLMNQAANNISAMRRGGLPQQSPMQAYQNAVMEQALHEKRMNSFGQQQQMNEQLMQQRAQQMNPFHNFEQARERGYIPEDMSLREFQTMVLRQNHGTAPMQNFQQWLQLNPNASPQEQARAFDNMVRAPVTWQTGPGMIGVTGGITPGGSGTSELGDYQVTAGREAVLAGGTKQAEQDVMTTQQQLNDALGQISGLREGYNVAANMQRVSQEYLNALETGAVGTGLAESFMLNTFGVGSAELAAMNAEQVEQVLNNLQITNLAPVTVQELRTVAGLWADIAKSEEPNKGVLRRAIERTQRAMDRVQSEAVMQADAVREFGGQWRFDSLMRSSPWLQGIYPTGGEPTDDGVEIEF